MVDFGRTRDHLRQLVHQVLQVFPHGDRALVVEPELSPLLSTVAGVKFLRESGAKEVMHLSPEPLETACPILLYVARPHPQTVSAIAKQIKQHRSAREAKERANPEAPPEEVCEYACFFVPKATPVVMQLLEAEGLYGLVRTSELPMHFTPIDRTFASLALTDSFRDCLLHRDRGVLQATADALMQLQSLHGCIPHLTALGPRAIAVKDLLVRACRDGPVDDEGNASPGLVARQAKGGNGSDIRYCIIIDRAADLVTPLMTQLTYAGMLEETFGINSGYIALDTGEVMRQFRLTEEDPIYARIGDMAFGRVLKSLKTIVQDVHDKVTIADGIQSLSMSELRQFVKAVPGIAKEKDAAATHIHLSGLIAKQAEDRDFMRLLRLEFDSLHLDALDDVRAGIEELIHRQRPLHKVLRVLCLYSLARKGLKQSQHDAFRQQILHTYGYHHLTTLHSLAKVGMLVSKEGFKANPWGFDWDWSSLSKAFDLLVEVEEDHGSVDARPSDIGYVHSYSGYAPLSARLLDKCLDPPARARQGHPAGKPIGKSGGMGNVQRAWRHLPCEEYSHAELRDQAELAEESEQAVLVVMVGGATMTELAAMRWVAQKHNTQLLVATTSLLSGDKAMHQLLAPDPAPLKP